MRRFRLSEAADSDLRKIAKETFQRWGEGQRDSYLAEMFEAFERLAEAPDIAMRLDNVRKGYRKFPQGSHVIFFRKSAIHEIEIIRVLHKRMDVEAQLSSP